MNGKRGGAVSSPALQTSISGGPPGFALEGFNARRRAGVGPGGSL